ncbi:integrase family protein [Thermodesulfatator indicus DSM 15286]|uniref:Integrase family protein n=1 Tax=Thermodesulfatator indicus (strain DSM 15286 / JCM 11887 / CIR29812) TaxID=667014 RepID=F8ACQ5_THEID|nr:site-specific integrase [Thermodesulfatator indicus]AEH45834.1 integrase family protein [Thermodesulfatator indicus DSM 15286]
MLVKIRMKLFRRKNGYWYIRFERGKEKSLRTKDKRLAERLFKEIQKEALKGRLILIEKQEKISLKTFIEEYLTLSESVKAYSTLKRERSIFKNFADFFGDCPIRAITPKKLEEYRAFLIKKGRKPAGINLDFRHLKAAFNKAQEWGYIKSNPFGKIKPLRDRQGPPRFISEEEMQQILIFLKEKDREFHDFVVLALETGCRLNELLRLTAKDVLPDLSCIRVVGKGNRERLVPLTENAKEILRPRLIKQGRLFDRWTDNWVSHKWRGYMTELGLDYRFHDIRHTTATWLAKKVPIQIIQELLGHSNISVTKIYAHVQKDAIKEALEEVFGHKKSGKTQAPSFLRLVK